MFAANIVGARHRFRVVGRVPGPGSGPCPGFGPCFDPGSILVEGFLARVVIGDIDHVFDLIDLGADGLFDAG